MRIRYSSHSSLDKSGSSQAGSAKLTFAFAFVVFGDNTKGHINPGLFAYLLVIQGAAEGHFILYSSKQFLTPHNTNINNSYPNTPPIPHNTYSYTCSPSCTCDYSPRCFYSCSCPPEPLCSYTNITLYSYVIPTLFSIRRIIGLRD